MKRLVYSFIFSISLCLACAFSAAAQQSSTFADKNVEYTFELPEPVWKMNLKPTAAEPNVEYIYGDRQNGYLKIEKDSLEGTKKLPDLVVEMDQKRQFRPGYVAGKEENFVGNYRGKVSNYEYIQSGKKMSGRVYFLQADDKKVYVLEFTGMRDSLRALRNQTDSIARTFKVNKTVN